MLYSRGVLNLLVPGSTLKLFQKLDPGVRDPAFPLCISTNCRSSVVHWEPIGGPDSGPRSSPHFAFEYPCYTKYSLPVQHTG